MLNLLDACISFLFPIVGVIYLVCLFKNLPKWRYRTIIAIELLMSVRLILLLVGGACTPLLFVGYVVLIAGWIYLSRDVKKKIN